MNALLIFVANLVKKLPREDIRRQNVSQKIIDEQKPLIVQQGLNKFLSKNKNKDAVDWYFITMAETERAFGMRPPKGKTMEEWDKEREEADKKRREEDEKLTKKFKSFECKTKMTIGDLLNKKE